MSPFHMRQEKKNVINQKSVCMFHWKGDSGRKVSFISKSCFSTVGKRSQWEYPRAYTHRVRHVMRHGTHAALRSFFRVFSSFPHIFSHGWKNKMAGEGNLLFNIYDIFIIQICKVCLTSHVGVVIKKTVLKMSTFMDFIDVIKQIRSMLRHYACIYESYWLKVWVPTPRLEPVSKLIHWIPKHGKRRPGKPTLTYINVLKQDVRSWGRWVPISHGGQKAMEVHHSSRTTLELSSKQVSKHADQGVFCGRSAHPGQLFLG